jgi:hypothetical protein
LLRAYRTRLRAREGGDQFCGGFSVRQICGAQLSVTASSNLQLSELRIIKRNLKVFAVVIIGTGAHNYFAALMAPQVNVDETYAVAVIIRDIKVGLLHRDDAHEFRRALRSAAASPMPPVRQ